MRLWKCAKCVSHNSFLTHIVLESRLPLDKGLGDLVAIFGPCNSFLLVHLLEPEVKYLMQRKQITMKSKGPELKKFCNFSLNPVRLS
jgi:hypothetical protein